LIRPGEWTGRTNPSPGEVACSALSTFMFGPAKAYHPEKHYMRGPGPKWREKHGTVQLLARDEVRG